jgi:hypothetical protein
MTGDPATPPPASDVGPGHGPFLPADSLNEGLLWTLHTPDSWARAITAAILERAQGVAPFQTGAVMEMTRHGDRVRVSLRFASFGPDGGAVDFVPVFQLTI